MPARPRIAVLGSCTLDIVFRMPRLPLAGETLFADAVAMHPGGKGLNQAIAAARLGADAALIGRVGDDAFARPLLDALAADGIDTAHVARDPAAGTGVAVPVVLPGGENSIFSAPRANLAIPVAQVEAARPVIEASRALLLQFEAPMDANLAAAHIAVAASVPVLLNPAPIVGHPPELRRLAAILVLNEVEAAMLAPGSGGHEARALALAGFGQAVCLTLGPEGVVLAHEGKAERIPAFPVEAVDSVAAGDAFCGALAVAIAEGRTLREAVRFACAAGAISVTRHGAAPSLPRRSEVEALLG
ncbi:MAG: ribokinase [Hyphomicrobiales bacterium]